MLRRTASCAALLVMFCAANAVATDAWTGANCGSNPGDLSSNPPNWWRYPNCAPGWQNQIPCDPDVGYAAFFFRWVNTQVDEWTARCCAPGHDGEVFWDYDEHGGLLHWGIECIPNT